MKEDPEVPGQDVVKDNGEGIRTTVPDLSDNPTNFLTVTGLVSTGRYDWGLKVNANVITAGYVLDELNLN